MKTSTEKPQAAKWFVVDANGQTLGRLATRVAHVLNGKHKVERSPHQIHSDHVVVINAEGLVLTGTKAEQKEYVRHSGYLGHIKRIPFARMFAKDPSHVFERAVRGMLPRNRLREKKLKHLHVYAGKEHSHEAQTPEDFSTLFPQSK